MNNQLISIGWIVLLFAIFYLLIIRPQQQKVKKHQQLISELKVGDSVRTIGGIYGKLVNIDDKICSLEIAPNVVVKLELQAVSAKV